MLSSKVGPDNVISSCSASQTQPAKILLDYVLVEDEQKGELQGILKPRVESVQVVQIKPGSVAERVSRRAAAVSHVPRVSDEKLCPFVSTL
jgi:hypothetical protein